MITRANRGRGRRVAVILLTNGVSREVNKKDLTGAAPAVDLEMELDHVAKYVCKASSLRILYKSKPALLIWSRNSSVPVFVFET